MNGANGPEQIEPVVIGAGQAGPATGYHLARARKPQTHFLEVRRVYERVLAGASVRSCYAEVGAGNRVHLLERGAGPPVVLLHGTTASAGFFLPLLNEFEGVRAMAPDRPGQGLSDPIDLLPNRYWPTAHAAGEAPREKGIDMALAIDFVAMAVRHEYDVGILMSTDTDLKPALEAVREFGRGPGYPRVEVAAWSGAGMHNRRLSIREPSSGAR